MGIIVRFHAPTLTLAPAPAAEASSREGDDEVIGIDALEQSPTRVFIDLLKHWYGFEHEGHIDFAGGALLDDIAYRRFSVNLQQRKAGIQEIGHVLVDIAGVVARAWRERHPGDSQWIEAAGDIHNRVDRRDIRQNRGIKARQEG